MGEVTHVSSEADVLQFVRRRCRFLSHHRDSVFTQVDGATLLGLSCASSHLIFPTFSDRELGLLLAQVESLRRREADQKTVSHQDITHGFCGDCMFRYDNRFLSHFAELHRRQPSSTPGDGVADCLRCRKLLTHKDTVKMQPRVNPNRRDTKLWDSSDRDDIYFQSVYGLTFTAKAEQETNAEVRSNCDVETKCVPKCACVGADASTAAMAGVFMCPTSCRSACGAAGKPTVRVVGWWPGSDAQTVEPAGLSSEELGKLRLGKAVSALEFQDFIDEAAESADPVIDRPARTTDAPRMPHAREYSPQTPPSPSVAMCTARSGGTSPELYQDAGWNDTQRRAKTRPSDVRTFKRLLECGDMGEQYHLETRAGLKQLRHFENTQQWHSFHPPRRYDDWVFPISYPTAYSGSAFQCSDAMRDLLILDTEYLLALQRAMHTVLLSWGLLASHVHSDVVRVRDPDRDGQKFERKWSWRMRQIVLCALHMKQRPLQKVLVSACRVLGDVDMDEDGSGEAIWTLGKRKGIRWWGNQGWLGGRLSDLLAECVGSPSLARAQRTIAEPPALSPLTEVAPLLPSPHALPLGAPLRDAHGLDIASMRPRLHIGPWGTASAPSHAIGALPIAPLLEPASTDKPRPGRNARVQGGLSDVAVPLSSGRPLAPPLAERVACKAVGRVDPVRPAQGRQTPVLAELVHPSLSSSMPNSARKPRAGGVPSPIGCYAHPENSEGGDNRAPVRSTLSPTQYVESV